MFSVRVPATSANVGSGFDAVGLAVNLYNTVQFDLAEALEITTTDGTEVPTDESNLVYRAAEYVFQQAGEPTPGMRIVQTNPIPMARGLGSSSACIIAGLLGANRLLDDYFGKEELLTMATEIEGHPDNVAPALFGGLTSCVLEGGKVYAVKKPVDNNLVFAALIPDYPLLTSAARAALPKSVTHKQAVYNLSRTGFLVPAFCEGRHDLLPVATQDALHQSYRLALMPGGERMFEVARQCGAKAVYVSGAGSTIMAVAEQSVAGGFYRGLASAIAREEELKPFHLVRLTADNVGATIEPMLH